MNKNYRIITINGVRGIITAAFVICGLIAGFIISPGWGCMKLWNFAFHQSNYFSEINMYQGILLWAIIALSLYALNNKRPLIGFGTCQGLSKEQIKDIMERARISQLNQLKEFEIMSKKIENSDNEVKTSDVEDLKEKKEMRN